MTISTSYFYDRSTLQLTRLGDTADKLQTQIATGKKLLSAADDSAGYQRLAIINRETANDKATANNLTIAQGLLAQTDSVLVTVQDRLQHAGELAVQANSGILTAENRESIALELDGILQDLVSLANSSDARGQPLFGGTSDQAAFTKSADGSIAYTGGGEPAPIPIGDGRSIVATESGDRAFGTDGNGVDLFKTVAALASAVRSGNSTAIGNAGDGITQALDQVSATRGSVGARAFRLDLEDQRRTDAGVTREAQRSAIEDIDVTSTITELQKTLTVLQATQASFAQLSKLSLFDNL